MKYFVTSAPGERMRIVSWWLRLERLQACVERLPALGSCMAKLHQGCASASCIVERELARAGSMPLRNESAAGRRPGGAAGARGSARGPARQAG